MSDNQGNPLQGSETDVQKAQKAINGLLEPKQEAKAEEPKEEIKQNSPEPQNEESQVDQPQEQEIKEEETESERRRSF